MKRAEGKHDAYRHLFMRLMHTCRGDILSIRGSRWRRLGSTSRHSGPVFPSLQDTGAATVCSSPGVAQWWTTLGQFMRWIVGSIKPSERWLPSRSVTDRNYAQQVCQALDFSTWRCDVSGAVAKSDVARVWMGGVFFLAFQKPKIQDKSVRTALIYATNVSMQG